MARNLSRKMSRDSRRRSLSACFEAPRFGFSVGCAPCQPYSSLNRRKLSKAEARKRCYPMYRFMRLVKATKPEIVSMENVPDLSNTKKYAVFGEFVTMLEMLGYEVFFKTVDTSRYGVPQRRQRLVLLASRLGSISLISETHDLRELVTVRNSIASLPRLKEGEIDRRDPLHRASALNAINKKRIKATPKDGGSATDWPRALMPKCYRKETGKSYMVTVYGRMRWDDPAPTITTQCTTLGTGRFGHPSQNRAISLREAAILQSFPGYYSFAPDGDVGIRRTARHIGNAVPVALGRAIGKSIKNHLRQHA